MFAKGDDVVEHPSSTVTVLLLGEAIGVWTFSGLVAGPVATSYRVWFHFLINVLATWYACWAFIHLHAGDRADRPSPRPLATSCVSVQAMLGGDSSSPEAGAGGVTGRPSLKLANLAGMGGNRETIERWQRALSASDLEELDSVFTDDVILEWPQMNERIVGNHNRREIYRRFPRLPKATFVRLTGEGDVFLAQVDLDYGDGAPVPAVFLFEMRDGLIARETGWWPQPIPAPEWRASWTEPIRPANQASPHGTTAGG